MAAWDPLDDLTKEQRNRLGQYSRLLAELNRRVNLVSPASSRQVESRHGRHSLALALRSFPPGSVVVDWGAGGGLPSIPLAIRFPDARFVAVDSVGKKVEAIRMFVRRLELENLEAWAGRAEQWPGKADYAVSRATAPLSDLWAWYEKVALDGGPVSPGAWPRGLVCLKGGDLRQEIGDLGARHPGTDVEVVSLGDVLDQDWAAGKVIVSVTGVASG